MKTITAKEFTAIPADALPGAEFASEAAAWAHSAWATLRESARTGASCESISGSPVRVWADRDGLRINDDVVVA